ncbi:hypothetical protein LTR66_005506 [Elasticomyces elasticus]|nr:hypothetical protein LTR28_009805 [Elasticomyces elasticus]KAK4994460.1 hypothetical protein LTR66_005506 [Elasticomyces elasticus]
MTRTVNNRRKRSPDADTYESDGGFIEDAPRSKRVKQNKSASNDMKQSDGKSTVSVGMQKDDEGCEFWELSAVRRATISTFKGAQMVNIREYYEKDGKKLPGKKGISLPVDQFAVIIEALPDIESVLSSRGITLPRPKYGAQAAKQPVDEGDEQTHEADEQTYKAEEDDVDNKVEQLKQPNSKDGRLDRFKCTKKNHEATSDEGGD